MLKSPMISSIVGTVKICASACARPQSLVVEEEESLLVSSQQRPPKRGAKIVLHQMIVAHRRKRSRIHRAVAKKLIRRSVILIGPPAGHDIDLSAARSAHVGRVTAGFDLELHDRVG